jgi:hypothetical protein
MELHNIIIVLLLFSSLPRWWFFAESEVARALLWRRPPLVYSVGPVLDAW